MTKYYFTRKICAVFTAIVMMLMMNSYWAFKC